MKKSHILVVAATLAAVTLPAGAGLKVHEWGTFTVLEGSDGAALEWYLPQASELPAFVKAPVGTTSAVSVASKITTPLARFGSQSGKDIVRMETPVLYFYPEAEMDVTVRASMAQGRITEVFPPALLTTDGSTTWKGTLSRPDSAELARVPGAEGAPGRHYGAARAVPEAWLFRGQPVKMQGPERDAAKTVAVVEPVDHFVFYRGAGNRRWAELTAVQDAQPDTYTVINNHGDAIPRVLALRVKDGQCSWTMIDHLSPPKFEEGRFLNQQKFTFSPAAGPAAEVAVRLRGVMVETLTAEGLTPAEAAAMVATWDDLWFTEPGTRLLAVLPQSLADAMVPLKITPAPSELDRVFVARVELVSRDQEQAMAALLTEPAGTQDKPAASRKLAELGLGRFGAGALERASVLVKEAMHLRFAELSRAGK